MGGVSADGKVLWLSGRYNAEVYAFDTTGDGHLIKRKLRSAKVRTGFAYSRNLDATPWAIPAFTADIIRPTKLCRKEAGMLATRLFILFIALDGVNACFRGRPRRSYLYERTSRRSSSALARIAIGTVRSPRCHSLHYKESRPWARSIKEKVARRQMPPWHIDRNVGIEQIQRRSVFDGLTEIGDHLRSGWMRGRRKAIRLTCLRPRIFSDADKWHIGKPDHDRLHAEALQAEGERARRVLRHRCRSGLSKKTCMCRLSRLSRTVVSRWCITPIPIL